MASPLSSKSARPTPNCECVSRGISFHTANPEQDACPRCLLTPKQRDINHRLLSAPKRHTLLYGGARSGKTVLFVRAIMMRAIHAPETRHAMLRLRECCKSFFVVGYAAQSAAGILPEVHIARSPAGRLCRDRRKRLADLDCRHRR